MAELGVFAVDEPGTENIFEPIPIGEYVLAVTESSRVLTKDQTSEYLKLTLEVLEGEFKGRKVFENLNLWHPTEATARIAKSQLNGLCHACGFASGFQVKDSAELHNLPFRAKVGMSKGSAAFEPQNCIKKYIFEDTRTVTNAATKQAATVVQGQKKAPWAK